MMSNLKATTYSDIRDLIFRSRSGEPVIGHNTRATYDECDDAIIVRYHGHPIATLYGPEASHYVHLDDCGWWTVSTRRRLNQLAPDGVLVFQRNNEAWVSSHQGDTYWTGSAMFNQEGVML